MVRSVVIAYVCVLATAVAAAAQLAGRIELNVASLPIWVSGIAVFSVDHDSLRGGSRAMLAATLALPAAWAGVALAYYTGMLVGHDDDLRLWLVGVGAVTAVTVRWFLNAADAPRGVEPVA